MYFTVLPTCFSSDICRRNTLSFGCDYILKNNLIWNCFIPVLYGHWSDHMWGGGGTGMILMSYFTSTKTWLRLDCVLVCFIKFHFHTYSFNNQIKVGWYQIVHDYIFNYHHNRLGSVSLYREVSPYEVVSLATIISMPRFFFFLIPLYPSSD